MNLCSKLRSAVAVASLGLSAAIGRAAPTTQPTRPNVVLIVADDLGYGDISCYRQDPANVDSPVFTPHIDALAAQGVKFTRAYAMPMCSPSRAALLTGRFPQRYGFYG